MRRSIIVIAGVTALALGGCSGGGSSGSSGGGTVTGLAVASNVSVVDAQQTTSTSKLASSLRKLAALSSVPADSDYNRDQTNVYVNEKAGEAFRTVNMILCMVDQTKYADMVNKGFYKAMVNSTVCQGNDDAANSGASSQGDTSASSAPSYDIWTVKSERSSSTSAQVLTAYVHMAKGGPNNEPMTVHAKMTISEGKSDANPLGIFSLNYKGFMDASPGMDVMKGILKTERDSSGKVVIKFAEKEGPGSTPNRNVKAAYIKDDTAKTGQGSAYMYENYGQVMEGSINFAYNDSYFKRVNPETGLGPCLDRKNFETSAWRYGLYDATSGSRATLSGGFPINTKADGSGDFGYLGYYGLNFPPGTTPLADGTTVYKKTWSNGSETTTPYTIFARGGKLKKHTRSITTLADIKNIPLEGNIPSPGGGSMGDSIYRLTWSDDGKLAIRATGVMSQSGPIIWTDLSVPTPIETVTLPWNNLSLYSQGLGGQVNIQLSGCTAKEQMNPGAGFICAPPAGDTQVVFYKESAVYPSDTVPTTLACYDNCPKAGSNGIDGTSQQTMTYPMSFDPTANNRHDYTFSDMLLMDGAYSALLLTAPAGQPWGFNSGALFAPTPDNMALLACDWDQQQTCGWKAWSVLPEFYTWETGPNSWNQFTAAKDGNSFVKFDPPWQVTYIHSQSDASAYDFRYNGSKFFLQYNGFGDLHGIPGKCVNPNDPSQIVTDCSQPGLRWVPEFTIPADSTVTANNTTYLVKPLDVEQRMKKINVPGTCSALNPTDMSGSMPNVDSDWVDPNLPAEPTITDSPRVIAGVIQS